MGKGKGRERKGREGKGREKKGKETSARLNKSSLFFHGDRWYE